jgi:hypothetical protein
MNDSCAAIVYQTRIIQSPGDTHHLIDVKLSPTVSPAVLKKHHVELNFCYCSLNDSCWTLHSVVGVVTADDPLRISSCPIDKGIAVQLL